MSRLALGIDLGTTHCALASVDLAADDARPVSFAIPQLVAPGEQNELTLLASFLYRPAESEYGAGKLALPWNENAHDVVGGFARTQGGATPARLVSSAKSWLSHPAVDRRAAMLPWQSPDEVSKLSPLDASARYLEHLRAAWDWRHPDAPLAEQDVVLTVPASFDAVARELTVEAARLAGLPENLRLLEEPQAALYAWLADRGHAWRAELAPGDVILVIDIGGGTTDFSLIAVRDAGGQVELERIAVGEHILLGGDNMDLALAYAVRRRMEGEGHKIDDWQMRALTHACRVAKESLLGDPSRVDYPLAVAGRSSKLMGQTLRATLGREELETLLLEGFFPEAGSDARPQAPRRAGLTTLGLPYAADPAITRHLAAFLGRQGLEKKPGQSFVHPTAVLFNGGVTRSPILRERLQQILGRWALAEKGRPPKILSGADPDLAVSRGAAYYALSRAKGGVRIRGGTAQAYYVGIERGELAVPGVPPRVDALCIAPFGLEEGSQVALPMTLGLIVGEPVSFRFFGSATRKDDRVGAVVDPESLTELAPIETAFAGEAGRVAQVRLEAHVTEVGTLELFAVEDASGERWRLSFDVRVQ